MPAQFTKHFVQDLTQDIKIRQCGTIVFNKDDNSNILSVDLYNGQEEYSGGGSVAGACICPDGSTVPLTGSIDGKTASVTLTGDCFAFPGQIGIGVQVISGTVKTTVLKAIYNVELFETDDVVDPGSRLTVSVADLVQDIADAVATIPADYSDLLVTIAPTFSTSNAYKAGQYVWYDGNLYQFAYDHAAGSWAGTDAIQTGIEKEIETANSMIGSVFSGSTVMSPSWSQGKISSNGSNSDSSSTVSIRTTHTQIATSMVHIGIAQAAAGSGYTFKWFLYTTSANDSLIDKAADWVKEAHIALQPGYYIRLMAQKNDGLGTISASEGTNIVISAESLTDITMTLRDKAADASLVGAHVTADSVITSNSFPLYQGTITGSGANSNSTKRIRTNYIETGFGLSLTIPSGIVGRVCYYSSQDVSGFTEIFPHDYTGAAKIAPVSKYCRFVFFYENGNDITPSAFTDSVVSLSQYAPTDETLSKHWKAADAKVTGDRIDILMNGYKPEELDIAATLGTTTYPTGWRPGEWSDSGSLSISDTAICPTGRIGFPGGSNQRANAMGMKITFTFGKLVVKRFQNSVLVETMEYSDGIAYIPTKDGDLMSVSITGLDSPSSDYISNGDVADIHVYILFAQTKKAGYTSTEFFYVPINKTWPSGSADENNVVNVDCVLKLPTSYTSGGDPTRLVFMHHGNSGTVNVANETWYSEVNVWANFVNTYLNAGYAVFDVNGCGPVTDSDASHDYGAFGALQAAYKAYEYIKRKYNVKDRIFVHGSSMGGATVYAFAKMFGGIVDAIGLFSPALLSRSAQLDAADDYISVNYGYADVAEMVADNYSHLLPANPTIEYYHDGVKVEKPYTYDWVNNHTEDGLTIICKDFNIPIKIWCGTSDAVVDMNYGDELAKAILSAGGMAIFRPVEGGNHNAGLGNNSTVNAEAIMWFNRFN